MEIGSEFWLENKDRTGKIKYSIDENKNKILFMSGRTAIDYALDMIVKKTEVKNVYFPSYCCDSMLAPFLKRNLTIEFYDVSFKDGRFFYDIDCNKKCNVFFAMNYFGFSCNNMDYYIDSFKKQNVVVIEDSTHSWLSTRKYNLNSDIVVASLRKWFPIISGGILINLSKKFEFDKIDELKENYKYTTLKKKAMETKSKYMNNKEKIDKKLFLQEFSKANENLKKDYKKYKIDKLSQEILEKIDVEEFINRRKENTEVLYKYLKNQPKIEYIKNLDLRKDCPIFVPIFLENSEERDKLRNRLIQNQVYAPNHWNIPGIVKEEKQKDIYNREISLICDQRYSKNEILNYLKYM